MKTILVTGATGFLGKRICKDLLERGYVVVAQGRNKRIGKELEQIGCRFFCIDLRDDLRDLTKGIDCIIHSAALSSPWGKKEDFLNINYYGTQKLLRSAIKNNVKRFIYISSTSVYFNFNDRLNIKESDSVAKSSPSLYTQTKLMAENEILDRSSDIETIILRPRGIFGPYDTTLIPRLVIAHDKGKLAIIGKEDTLVDVTYVGNVSHASILAITSDKNSIGEIYNITNGEPVKIWEMIDFILTSLGRELNKKIIPYRIVSCFAYLSELYCSLPFIKTEPVLTRYTAGLLAKSQTLNISKAEKKLNYKPIKDMNDALKETIDWYIEEIDNGS